METGIKVLGLGLLLSLIALFLTGCATPTANGNKEAKPLAKQETSKKGVFFVGKTPSSQTLTPREPWKEEEDVALTKIAQAVKDDYPEYKIQPGDVVEIIYQVLYEENPSQYLLEIQDSIKIEFFSQPDLTRTVNLRLDGKITLPLVGDVPAAGLSTQQLEEELIQRYKKYLLDPIITVYLEHINVKTDELKKAITTTTRGQGMSTLVRPDGRISLPFIGDMRVAGLTVEEVRNLINEKYRQQVRNLEVTVVIEKVVNSTIFVSGEVNSPGDLTVTGPLFLSQAISRAKGLTPKADGKHVMVIRRFGVSMPVVLYVDLDEVLLKVDITKDVLLTENDLVYVPRASRY